MGLELAGSNKYTKIDIEKDYLDNGRSTIMKKIALEKKKNGCDCASKNPKGSWCLGDIHQVVKKISETRK